ncbi:prenyltransferase/squalene oxidase repeat-containing protein [Allostreptomyces psammosilenae]|uniref:Uncharacterized protein n=1 Tax=Allostreptomyces psammosilenae TaxID=1892865 RepID=A0A853A1K4_9ACTN|nr:prenyltransferase/squalene oxidase repeat-containing protein [Allostreptomyces psammosilenae]NYI06794.1 hypothetical protein [Allostreptomyces psammosilenae]
MSSAAHNRAGQLLATATATAVAAVALLGAAPAAAGTAADPAGAAPSATPAASGALYGAADPTYDGVFRQSLALLALDAVGAVPAESAVDWLLEQQCADGGWTSYRADASVACETGTEDTNASAVAVQALVAVEGLDATGAAIGEADEARQARVDTAVHNALGWLRAVQNRDGGWSYYPGDTSDGNSTALVTSAFLATGTDPGTVVRAGTSARDGLLSFQVDCAAPADQRGGFAFQRDGETATTANDLASAQAGIAAAGSALQVTRPAERTAAPSPLPCPADDAAAGTATATATDAATETASADAVAAHLAARLEQGGGHLEMVMPGAAPTPDAGATAYAALALAAAGYPDQASAAVDWLTANSAEFLAGDSPSALGVLVLAAVATGQSPTDFGGVDLIARLAATGPEPAAGPGSVPEPSAEAALVAADGADSGTRDGSSGPGTALWAAVGGLAVLVAAGVMVSMRRRGGAE